MGDSIGDLVRRLRVEQFGEDQKVFGRFESRHFTCPTCGIKNVASVRGEPQGSDTMFGRAVGERTPERTASACGICQGALVGPWAT